MQCHNMSLHGTESAAGIDTVDCIRKATKNVFSDFQTTWENSKQKRRSVLLFMYKHSEKQQKKQAEWKLIITRNSTIITEINEDKLDMTSPSTW